MTTDTRRTNTGESLAEMMRIMDVATALRREREKAEDELDFDETRKRLRKRLLNAAAATGEKVTPEEVEVAIDRYFDELYTYEEPRRGLKMLLARLYVRRKAVLGGLAALLLIVSFAWVATVVFNRTFSNEAKLARELPKITQEIERRRDRARALAKEPEAREEIDRLWKQADAAREHDDLDGLRTARDRLAELEATLDAAYTVTVVHGPNRMSGIDRYHEDSRSRHAYVIVEALDSSGKALRQSIRNVEENKAKTVERWGERVPDAVWERLKRDKMEDGILDETVFAVKRRGYRKIDVRMKDADGTPLERQAQITEW